jgi:hypothetical protein
MINSIFFLCYQLEISDTQFNLYHTDKSLMMSTFGHDCLYYEIDEAIHSSKGLVPFCTRPEKVKESNDECNGKLLTFKELKTNNVSIRDLFWWNGVIEILDLYEKYLLLPNLVNDDEVYCNCSSLSRFGKSCQYDISTDDNDERSFTNLLPYDRFSSLGEELENAYSTCYIGLKCQTNLFCLDWRQICNGIVDCDYGEDEPAELCLQMESNQCHPENEFRCKTGLCIPNTMASNVIEACPDRSIGTVITPSYLFELCLRYPPLECDETNYGWKLFSCNNGQSISFSDLTSKSDQTCANNHHLKYLRKLFSTNDENECWKSMICLTGFDYLYSNLNCSNEESSCPNQFYFPSNSVVYSFVYFLYDKTNRINWPNPNYICYKKEFCPNNTLNLSTISKNDLTCFYVNQTNFSWKNFYESILYLFSSCFSSSISINDKMLYKCNLSQSFISIYRLQDKNKDCFFNEDENPNIDLCSFNINDLFKCLINQSQCIRELFLGDNEYDCVDGSDEYIQRINFHCDDPSCEFRSWSKRNLSQIYRFEELCDNIVNYHLFSLESNETDETDCEYWSYTCYSYYTRCNRIWNCPNGSDEINCEFEYNDYIRKALHCKSNEQYCIQLINNNLNATCININRTGDGIIDCIGGTDERLTNICLEKYPTEFQRRFRCMNSSFCIRIDQVCDTISDCPFQDDELICPWLFKSNSSKFYCENSPLDPVVRCDKYAYTPYCQMKEHLWFCDLDLEGQITTMSLSIPFEPYPPINQNVKSISNPNKLAISSELTLSSIEINPDLSLCNLGYPIKSSILNNKFYCFCSPSYYGDNCQYQSSRLTVLLKAQSLYYMNLLTVFRLVIYLLNENNLIVSYDEIVFNPVSLYFGSTHLIYLMSERVTNLSLHQQSKSKFVRIDSYIIKETNVQYISSWFFNVSFPFLPVNRLVVDLFLVNESFKVLYCQKRCGSHGKCFHYLNSKEREYCWCDQGWKGENCQLKSSCNSTSCSPHSQCVILNDEKKQMKCICPLGKSGDQCYITYNSCYRKPCLNDEICLPLNQGKSGYVCICNDDYNGSNCGTTRSYLNISIDGNITDLSSIRTIIIIIVTKSDNILQQYGRRLFKNVRLPTNLKISGPSQDFGFVRMFHNFSRSFYYLVLINERTSPFDVNTSVISRNLCPNVSEIFNKTILNEYSYLKRLKLYHLPCNSDHNLRCFFDEYRMCICTSDHNSDCYFINHEHSNCNYCKNNGLCLREDSKQNQWNYDCLCPKCSSGSLCQFIDGNYFITFDRLIGMDIKTGETSFNQQSTVIHLTLMFILIILLISLIFNTISIFVFSNKELRQVGCDLYLLYITIVSEIGLILLFLRFLYMIIIQMYVVDNLLFIKISCISLEYSLRLIPSLFDWLTVCISIERAYTVIKDVQFTKLIALKTLKLSRWIILIVFLLNMLTTLHRPFYLILVDELDLNDEPAGHPWCVLDLASTSWSIYEKIINICHLIIPFILNLLSMIAFILHKTKFELISTARKNKDTRFFIMKEQLLKYKPLIISPIIILILEIPRFVLTFTLACIDHPWQRYVYLTGYLISFLPLTGVLFIYILPSPKYKKQLQTFVKKRFRISLFRTA